VKPWCVGVHYFTMYDQSALGRFDGECYNIGFLAVCNRPYPELCAAARASHERIYDVAMGESCRRSPMPPSTCRCCSCGRRRRLAANPAFGIMASKIAIRRGRDAWDLGTRLTPIPFAAMSRP
jgi:hypothetical protein